MSTKGPTNHKPISNVGSGESSLSKASGTKFCSLYQLSPRMLTYFKNTFRIAYYCLAVMILPFGIKCSTFGGWFRRLVGSFQISPAEFESSILLCFYTFENFVFRLHAATVETEWVLMFCKLHVQHLYWIISEFVQKVFCLVDVHF